jgi:hypothetical protein
VGDDDLGDVLVLNREIVGQDQWVRQVRLVEITVDVKTDYRIAEVLKGGFDLQRDLAPNISFSAHERMAG